MIVHVSQSNLQFINFDRPVVCDGIFFFVTHIENATRYCYPNGTWENANFDQCQYLGEATMVHEFTPSVDLPFYIYCLGYILSLVSLSLGLAVFIYFKQVFSFTMHIFNSMEIDANTFFIGSDRIFFRCWYWLHAFVWRNEGEQVYSYDNLFSRDLRCLRNTIHANLFLTYILAALLWLSITLIYQVSHIVLCVPERLRRCLPCCVLPTHSVTFAFRLTSNAFSNNSFVESTTQR